jgi:hypothetical protein
VNFTGQRKPAPGFYGPPHPPFDWQGDPDFWFPFDETACSSNQHRDIVSGLRSAYFTGVAGTTVMRGNSQGSGIFMPQDASTNTGPYLRWDLPGIQNHDYTSYTMAIRVRYDISVASDPDKTIITLAYTPGSGGGRNFSLSYNPSSVNAELRVHHGDETRTVWLNAFRDLRPLIADKMTAIVVTWDLPYLNIFFDGALIGSWSNWIAKPNNLNGAVFLTGNGPKSQTHAGGDYGMVYWTKDRWSDGQATLWTMDPWGFYRGEIDRYVSW